MCSITFGEAPAGANDGYKVIDQITTWQEQFPDFFT